MKFVNVTLVISCDYKAKSYFNTLFTLAGLLPVCSQYTLTTEHLQGWVSRFLKLHVFFLAAHIFISILFLPMFNIIIRSTAIIQV